MDSSSPYVEWDDEYSALRGNLNTFFNMAIMMVLSFVVVILGIVLYELLKLPIMAYYIIMLAVLIGVFLRLFVVGKRAILGNMDKMS